MLETVLKNFEGFTKKKVEKTILAHEAQAMVEYPPDERFKQMVSHESLINCNFKVDNITNA